MRSLARSAGASQVAPDILLARRFAWPIHVGSMEGAAHPLYDANGNPSLFFGLGGLRAVGLAAGRAVPEIVWTTPIWYAQGIQAKEYVKDGKTSVPLFTATSKMACPSFSLPAGPTQEGGSCAAANPAKTGKGLRDEGKTYICDGCYSLERNYVYAEVALAQAARLAWVLQSLDADPTGQQLAADLVGALSEYARTVTLQSVGDGVLVRLCSELGVWRGGSLRVPFPAGVGSKRRVEHEAVVTDLPPQTGFSTTRDFFRSRNIPEGSIAGFFRIHDSGDLTVGNKPSRWTAYLRAWVTVAQALPHVVFWLPTRTWVFPSLKKAIQDAAAAAPNLVIRASALHIGDAVPVLPGVGAGSTVVVRPDPKSRGQADPLPSGSTVCPVYLPRWDPDAEASLQKDRERGRRGAWVEDSSCQEAGCRRCWLDRNVGIAYGAH